MNKLRERDVAISEISVPESNHTAKIYVGDCVQAMKMMPDQSVNCCVTSPPYFGLRDYGMNGQIGLEETPEEYIQRLVEVFREVRRVLRDDGVLWLNIGDSYASRNSGNFGYNDGRVNRDKRKAAGIPKGIKEKDLIGIPWMLAFALRADGWYLRQDIIWHKPNPMPESVRDRCTKAHEYIFLLSKSAKYHFDSAAMKEPAKRAGDIPGGKGHYIQHSAGGHNKDGLAANGQKPVAELRNRRSVWSVATKPYKGAHFATFPPDLIEPCILAGCPEGSVVLDPFGGSGTTAGVAIKHSRDAIICELNPEYAALIDDRVTSILHHRKNDSALSENIDEKTLDLFEQPSL